MLSHKFLMISNSKLFKERYSYKAFRLQFNTLFDTIEQKFFRSVWTKYRISFDTDNDHLFIVVQIHTLFQIKINMWP